MGHPYDIGFVHLGIYIPHLKNHISIFGYPVMFYGIIIATGILAGTLIAAADAKRRGQDPELYIDFLFWAVIMAVIGARAYYVIFNWKVYQSNPIQIFNIRGGGLAIYGGILAAALTLAVYTRRKKIPFLMMADTCCLGLVTGQMIGRWGNFFNCEAFGGYTNGPLAMQIRTALVDPSNLTGSVMQHQIMVGGTAYIQVEPTFLYESLWSLGVLLLLLWYRKRAKEQGQVFSLYLAGYGVGRFWIEGLRTDQLLLWNTHIPVSQIVSVVLVCLGVVLWLWERSAGKRKISC